MSRSSRPSLRFRLSTDRQRVTLGVVLVCLIYVATSSYAAITLPLPGTVDALHHLDYIYQVSLGQLPDPYGFELVPDENRRQLASAHPPFYYAIMAFVVGGLLPEQLGLAIAIVRALNILLGALTVITIAWFGYTVGGRYRASLAIGMAAISASSFTMIRFGAEVYSDMQVTLCATTALALTSHIIIKQRITWLHAIGLTLACTIGLGTKATFIVTLAVVAGGICLTGLVRWVNGARRQAVALIGAAIGTVAVSISANAWFYLINLERSGSLHRSTPKTPLSWRTERSTIDALVDPEFWLIIGQGFVGKGSDEFAGFAAVTGALTIGGLLLANVAVVLWRIARHAVHLRTPQLIIALMLVLSIIGTYATQLSHATGYGAYNFRYFMPAILPIAFFLVLGFAMLRRGLTLISVAAISLAFFNALSVTIYAINALEMPTLLMGTPFLIAETNGIAPQTLTFTVIIATLASLSLTFLSPVVTPATHVGREPSSSEGRWNYDDTGASFGEDHGRAGSGDSGIRTHD